MIKMTQIKQAEGAYHYTVKLLSVVLNNSHVFCSLRLDDSYEDKSFNGYFPIGRQVVLHGSTCPRSEHRSQTSHTRGK